MHENNLSSVDLNLLKVFNEVEKRGSVTGAANALGLGQPAVSQALSRLREMLKDDLFVRSPGGMSPTPRAQELIGPLRLALAQIEDAVFGAQDFEPQKTHTRFRLGASDYAAAILLPGIKRRLSTQMPYANLAVLRADRSNAEHLLTTGEIDFAIGMFPAPGAWIRRRKLFKEHHVCVFNPERVDLADPLTAEQYAAHEHMLVSLDGSARGFVDDALEKIGLRRRISVTTPYFLQSAYLLERLPLIATLPARFVNGCSTLSKMSIRSLPFETSGFDVSAIWRASDDRSPRIAAIRDLIIETSRQGGAL